jgi:hypothetical protein
MRLIELSLGVPSQQALTHFLKHQVAAAFPSFTVLYGSGYWQGNREDCALIRVYSAAAGDELKAYHLAAVYCQITKEDCVLVSVSGVESANLINAAGEVTSL